MVSVNHPFPIKLIYSFPFFFPFFFMACFFSPFFPPKVVLSEAASNCIVRTQHSVTPSATSGHLLHIPFCWAVSRGLKLVLFYVLLTHGEITERNTSYILDTTVKHCLKKKPPMLTKWQDAFTIEMLQESVSYREKLLLLLKSNF